jgi:hypothetical protein
VHLLLVTWLVLAGAAVSTPAAQAHGGEVTASAKEAVLQAIAHIVHDPSAVEAIRDKVGDSLEAEDAAGVNLVLVQRAQVAVEGRHMMRARTLLERAIGARSDMSGAGMRPILQVPRGDSGVALAVGTGTGTSVVTDELPGRGGLTGADISLLVLAAMMAVGGVVLSFRLRPADSVRALRRHAAQLGGRGPR